MPCPRPHVVQLAIHHDVSIRAEDVATIMALLAGDVVLRQRILSKIVQTVEEQANVRVSNFVM